MKAIYVVSSATRPEVEIDFQAKSAYIRFSKKKVAKTIPNHRADGMFTAVDLDSKGEVVGVEAVNFTEFTIEKLIHETKIDASRVDFGRTSIRPAPQEFAAV